MPVSGKRAEGLLIVPIAFLVHNIEEAVTIGGALPKMQVWLRTWLGPSVLLPSADEYYWALGAITLASFVIWLVARRWDSVSYALVVLQAVMTLNVATHLFGALSLQGYAPGLVTALLVEAPTSVVVFRRVRRAGWMSRGQWVLLPFLVAVIHGPGLVGLLLLVRGL